MSALVSKTPLRQVASVKELLANSNARDQLSAVAAKHMNPERMMRVLANAIRTTPKLGECEPMSLLGALMQCASLGIEPNTILGQAYLIPFGKDVQLVVGYKGLIDLARRSGNITSISANIHYSDDELWEYEEGTEARLRHRPGMMKGEKLHAYAIAKFTDGGHGYVVLPWAHVEKIRDESQGYQTAKRYGKLKSSPWVKHEDEMAKKTAIRALAKYLPLSVEKSDLADAMQTDESRADFRAFAMDPTAGVQIDGETVDAESGEVMNDRPAQIEDTSAQQQTIDAEPRERAEPRQRRDETPYTEMTNDTKSVVDPAQWQAIVDRIASDLLDGAKPQDLIRDFAPQIASMKVEAPGIYQNLRAEIEGYAPDLMGSF